MTNSEAKKLFLDAYNLIKDKEHWCQGSMAAFTTPDGKRHTADLASSFATCWCSIGALVKAGVQNGVLEDDNFSTFQHSEHMQYLMDQFNKHIHPLIPEISRRNFSLMNYNDKTTHEEIMRIWTAVGQEKGWL